MRKWISRWRGPVLWARIVQSTLLCVIAVVMLGAARSQYDRIGHEMVCQCGCGQILIECNHLGCQYSEAELTELRTALHEGKSDTEILELFQAKYGPTVLAAPMLTKFNLAAWFVPPVVLLIGIAATIALVRKWKLRTVEMPVVPTTPTFQTARDRIRRETEL